MTTVEVNYLEISFDLVYNTIKPRQRSDNKNLGSPSFMDNLSHTNNVCQNTHTKTVKLKLSGASGNNTDISG